MKTIDDQVTVRKKKQKKSKALFTERGIVQELYLKKINERIPHEPGSKAYLSSYQRTVTEVTQGLTKSEAEEVANTTEERNRNGPPVGVQQM